MIRLILKQLWHQRRTNGWIFIELVIVSFFLWFIIKPSYKLLADMSIEQGYNVDKTYRLDLGYYPENHRLYQEQHDTDSARVEDFRRLLETLRAMPELESYTCVPASSYINSSSNSGSELKRIIDGDTIASYFQYMTTTVADGSDMFRTFGLNDAYTGKIMQQKPFSTEGGIVYITQSLADKFFYKDEDPVGKTLFKARREGYEPVRVAGVLQNFKSRDFEQPGPIAIFPQHQFDLEGGYTKYNSSLICFRLKSQVDQAAFEKRFEQEVAPKMNTGNFYYVKIISFDDILKENMRLFGYENNMRSTFIMTSFGLVCIFLGMVGTFWIQCNARRPEIGLMCAMGASRSRIRRQFLYESWLMVTIAYLVAVPFLLHVQHEFWNTPFFAHTEYVQDQPLLSFLIISAITYPLLVIIALIGTYIPVNQAAKIQPADALRDE